MNTATPSAYPTIVALDGSTAITGVALLVPEPDGEGGFRYTAHGKALNAHAGARDAEGVAVSRSDTSALMARLRWTRAEIARFLSELNVAIDVVVYEKDTGRGHYASAGMQMATGAYLTLSRFKQLGPDGIVGVTRSQACSASGTGSIYREAKGKTPAEQKAKKARLKKAVVLWAIDTYCEAFSGIPMGYSHTAEMEAIADALAVGQVVINQHKALVEAAQRKAQQKTMRLTRTPQPKAGVPNE